MDKRIIAIIAVLVVVIIACIIYLLARPKDSKKPIFVDESLFGLFTPGNIIGVDFIRNKIVVSFKDISLFDVNKLKELGGKGISVVGDKIKFFISDEVSDNEKLYNELTERTKR